MDKQEQVGRLIPVRKLPSLREEYPLYKDSISVGRHPSNDVSLVHESVSRFHSRIDYTGDRFTVADLNSSNGTYVNGMRVQQCPLRDGDLVVFGTVGFEFSLRAPSPEEQEETSVTIVTQEKEGSTIEKAVDVETTSLPGTMLETLDRSGLIQTHNRLLSLYKLSDLLRSALTEPEMLEKVINLMFDTLTVDRGVILLKDPTGELKPVIVRHREGSLVQPSETIALSSTIVNKCVDERVAILSRNAMADERFPTAESIVAHGICSTMCVPLIVYNNVIGLIHVDLTEPGRTFSEEDLSFLTSLGNELAVSIENLRLREEMIVKERMAAIGQTITHIAHSVKNILQLSKGGYELMERSLSAGSLENVKDSWDITRSGIDRISSLVRDMLNFSRVRTVEFEPANINELITKIAQQAQDELEQKEIILHLELDRSDIPKFNVDAQGLEKAIENLLVNAVDAVEPPDAQIGIRTVYKQQDDSLVITITDTGPGIPEEVKEKIFLPFFTTKGTGGTGLGLAMTKKVVESMGGKLDFSSEAGKGTAFYITLYTPVKSH